MSKSDIDVADKESKLIEDEEVYEHRVKECKQGLKGVLVGMAKVVNKPVHEGEDLNANLSTFLTELLSLNASKESHDELMEKLPMARNCQCTEIIRVNPEIFTSVRKISRRDVRLQKE